MLRRILRLVVLFPAVVVAAALGLANKHDVRLVLDPFRPDDPALSVVLPFYAWLLLALALGVLAGGLVVWLTQVRRRRGTGRDMAETQHWKAEAERLRRERQDDAARQLASAGR
jgi:hypothetical protein